PHAGEWRWLVERNRCSRKVDGTRRSSLGGGTRTGGRCKGKLRSWTIDKVACRKDDPNYRRRSPHPKSRRTELRARYGLRRWNRSSYRARDSVGDERHAGSHKTHPRTQWSGRSRGCFVPCPRTASSAQSSYCVKWRKPGA